MNQLPSGLQPNALPIELLYHNGEHGWIRTSEQQGCSLPPWASGTRAHIWEEGQDSNLHMPGPQSGALPVKLQSPYFAGPLKAALPHIGPVLKSGDPRENRTRISRLRIWLPAIRREDQIGTHSQIRTADRPRIRRVLCTTELSAYIGDLVTACYLLILSAIVDAEYESGFTSHPYPIAWTHPVSPWMRSLVLP